MSGICKPNSQFFNTLQNKSQGVGMGGSNFSGMQSKFNPTFNGQATNIGRAPNNTQTHSIFKNPSSNVTSFNSIGNSTSQASIFPSQQVGGIFNNQQNNSFPFNQQSESTVKMNQPISNVHCHENAKIIFKLNPQSSSINQATSFQPFNLLPMNFQPENSTSQSFMIPTENSAFSSFQAPPSLFHQQMQATPEICNNSLTTNADFISGVRMKYSILEF